MIVVDTQVLCELLKPAPAERVMAWFAARPRASLFTTTITRGEILAGIRSLPDGRRRHGLWEAARAIFDEDFAGRVLSFDSEAADAYADITARRRAAGRPISQSDAMIAALVSSRGASLATRNGKAFEGCGIGVIDPWE